MSKFDLRLGVAGLALIAIGVCFIALAVAMFVQMAQQL